MKFSGAWRIPEENGEKAIRLVKVCCNGDSVTIDSTIISTTQQLSSMQLAAKPILQGTKRSWQSAMLGTFRVLGSNPAIPSPRNLPPLSSV
jgi:hypothetical protein